MSHVSKCRRVSRVFAAASGLALAILLNLPAQLAAQTCDVAGSGACIDANVRHLARRTVTANAGDTVMVEVNNPTGGSVFFPPDPDVIVGYASGANQRLRIVAFDDDSHPGWALAPQLTFTAPVTATYEIYVVAPSRFNLGSGTLRVTRNGLQVMSSTVSYGTSMRTIAFRDGDSLLLTKSTTSPPSGSSPSYADTRLLVFDRSLMGNCQNGSCGWAWYNDEDMQSLSRVDVNPPASATGTAYVGTFSTVYSMHTRLYHLRRSTWDGGSWTHTDARDFDNDGLPRELEHALGTCDSSGSPGGLQVHARGTTNTSSCTAMRDFINQGQSCDASDTLSVSEDVTCWTPVDSDHDGLTDFEEIYGTRRCYGQNPDAGLGYVGPCVNLDGDLFCDNECTGTFSEELALSALDSPNDPLGEWRPVSPVHFDVLLETRYNHSTSQGQGQSFTRMLQPVQYNQIHYTWEEEPTECNNCARSECTFCPAGTTPDFDDFCRFDASGTGIGGCCDDPATDCPNDDRYEPRVHVYADNVTVNYDRTAPWYLNSSSQRISKTSAFGGVAIGYARFSFQMSSRRRYTNAFRLGALDGGTGGQSHIDVRSFVVGGVDTYPGRSIVHEMAHAQGLHHNGDGLEGGGNGHWEPWYTNYPSLMGCHAASMPLKTRALAQGQWDGVPPTCTSTADCGTSPGGVDYFVCVQTTDEQSNSIGYCLPRARQVDRNAQIWPYRFSRGTIPHVYDEWNEVVENSVAHLMYLYYFDNDQQPWCINNFPESSIELHRIRRFIDPNGNPRASCGVWTCDLDFDQDGTFVSNATSNGPIDVNRNAVLDDFRDGSGNQIGFVEQDDHDDWRRLLKNSKRPFVSEAAFQTYYRGTLLYATGFNAPAASHSVLDGSCTGTCDTQASAWNMMGWQPSVQLGSAVSFDDLNGSGQYGHFARFNGPGTDSHLTLAAHPRFEALGNSSAYPQFNGFIFRAWVDPEQMSSTSQGIVSNGLFWLYLSDTYVYVLLRDGSVWRPYVFSGAGYLWTGSQQRGIQLIYDANLQTLSLNISAAIFGGGGPGRDNANLAWFSDVQGTYSVSTPAVGDIVLGRVGSNTTLDGWLDDVAFYTL